MTSILPSPLMSAAFTPSRQYSPVSVSFSKASSRDLPDDAASATEAARPRKTTGTGRSFIGVARMSQHDAGDGEKTRGQGLGQGGTIELNCRSRRLSRKP